MSGAIEMNRVPKPGSCNKFAFITGIYMAFPQIIL